jgi:hypothetical protein
MEENYKNKQTKKKIIKVIDGDIHLNHNDNVTHDFPLYQPKIKQLKIFFFLENKSKNFTSYE